MKVSKCLIWIIAGAILCALCVCFVLFCVFPGRWSGVVVVLLLCVFVLISVILYRNRRTQSFAMETSIREMELESENTMLDAMGRMKTEFFQNMSHDLKTPLTVVSTCIMNTIDNLDYEMDKEDMRKSLSLAQSEVMRMSGMIDDAMRHTTMQDYRMKKEKLDLTRLLRDGSRTYRTTIERSGNRLVLKIPDELPPVYGSANALMHVLANLLSNANRYTHGGEIAVSAVAGIPDKAWGFGGDGAAEAGDAQFISVTVKDTGVGVNPGILPDIFTRGVSEGGTGLGLSICKTVVEEHGGGIGIESKPGKGTAVTFTLPVYKEEV